MNQCICENPQIIINPLIEELVAQYGNITIKGIETKFKTFKRKLYDFKKSSIHPRTLNIGRDVLDSCFVCDSVTHEHYPVYLEVPCGHCDVCKQSKVNAFVHRCKLETQNYTSKPLFITLTYDENHKKECGVCLRDVQLFFKRFRINLVRKGFREKIRYALCAEYGRRTHRPHYHALLWNLGQTDFLSYRDITDLIEKSWSNGFCMCRLVDPSNDKAFYYTSKYLRKDNNIPAGCNKTFLVCSNRGGSIGAPFIDRFAEQIRRTYNTKFKISNRWNGKVEPLQYNRYILYRLFPSLSKSMPLKLKKDVRQFVFDYKRLEERHNINLLKFKQTYDLCVNFYAHYFFVPTLSCAEVKSSYSESDEKIIAQALREEINITRSSRLGQIYYDKSVELDKCRKAFLEKLFAVTQEVDIKNKSYNARRAAALAAERELF